MTILSEDEFRRIETEWAGYPSPMGDIQDVPALIASHRLLAEEVARLTEALTKPGVLLFLDGRNEHGTHVLPMPMQTADITTNGDELDEDAETITQAAEAAGYPVGSIVWCEFRKIKGQYDGLGRCELEEHWEFVDINQMMTEMFGGRAPENDQDDGND